MSEIEVSYNEKDDRTELRLDGVYIGGIAGRLVKDPDLNRVANEHGSIWLDSLQTEE